MCNIISYIHTSMCICKYKMGMNFLQVKNTRQDEVEIEVSEQFPLSQDDRIKVYMYVFTLVEPSARMRSEGYCSWVCVSVCVLMPKLASQMSICAKNDTSYLTGDADQIMCGNFAINVFI